MFDFFKHIYCINLDSRADRWASVSKEFSKIEILDRVQRVSGIVGDGITKLERGEKGCTLSHIYCLKDAKQKGYKNILILEDDVWFSSNYSEILKNSVSEIKGMSWDMFYLGFGANDDDCKFSLHSDNLIKLSYNCLGTHAIAYNEKMIDIMLCNPNMYINERAFDRLIGKFIQTEYNCFSTNPPVVHQTNSKSSISDKRINLGDYYIKQYNSKSTTTKKIIV